MRKLFVFLTICIVATSLWGCGQSRENDKAEIVIDYNGYYEFQYVLNGQGKTLALEFVDGNAFFYRWTGDATIDNQVWGVYYSKGAHGNAVLLQYTEYGVTIKIEGIFCLAYNEKEKEYVEQFTIIEASSSVNINEELNLLRCIILTKSTKPECIYHQ